MFIGTLQELSRMEAIKEQKVQEDQSEASMVTEKESMCDIIIVQNFASPLHQVTVHFELIDFDDWAFRSGICHAIICLPLPFLAETSIMSDTNDNFKEDRNR